MPCGHTWISGQVKHEVAGRGVAEDEVPGDAGRPVVPVVADVRSPVAAVGEAPYGCDFGSEGGGGEIMDLPVVVEFYFCFSYLHFAVGLEELFVVCCK